MGDPFTGGDHEAWDAHDAALEALGIDKQEHDKKVSEMVAENKKKWNAEISWSTLCPACKGYPQGHTRDEHCRFPPKLPGIGGVVIQDIRIQTCDPGSEED